MERHPSKSGLDRRTVLIAAASAAPLLVLSAGVAQAKVAESSVAYQTSPHGSQRCGECNLFSSPDSCRLVSGKISPDGWCRLWVKKA